MPRSPRARILPALLLAGSACAPGLRRAAAPAAGDRTVIAMIDAGALGVSKRYLVHLPPSYRSAPARRYPVIYLLHGLTGTEADWVTRGDLPTLADSLAAAGVPEVIYVMPDGDNGWWSDWAETLVGPRCAEDPAKSESDATFCVGRAAYGEYLTQDMVGTIDASYRTIRDRSHRAIAGISMGGTGALTLGLGYPDRFAAVAAMSAPVTPLRLAGGSSGEVTTLSEWESARGRPLNPPWRARWGSDTATWWRHDPLRAARRGDGAPPAIRLDVGLDDPYLDENRAFASDLRALAIEATVEETSGGHDWVFWRRRAPVVLAWLATAINR